MSSGATDYVWIKLAIVKEDAYARVPILTSDFVANVAERA
jgi:hypothetical protein